MQRLENLINGGYREHGEKFDTSGLNPLFHRHYESKDRIEVQFCDSKGNVYETKRGRVGVTTGWKPVYLLMLTKRSVGSSYIIDHYTKFVRTVSK